MTHRNFLFSGIIKKWHALLIVLATGVFCFNPSSVWALALDCSFCHPAPHTTSDQVNCTVCHGGAYHTDSHDYTVLPDPMCAECHSPNVRIEHTDKRAISCGQCHTGNTVDIGCNPPGVTPATYPVEGVSFPLNPVFDDAIARGLAQIVIDCFACHDPAAANHAAAHDMLSATPSCSQCHVVSEFTEILTVHQNDCATCHSSTDPVVMDTIASGKGGVPVTCEDCHAAENHAQAHDQLSVSINCGACHDIFDFAGILAVHRQDCATCHGSTDSVVINTIALGKAGTPVTCESCHMVNSTLHSRHYDYVHHNYLSTYIDCATCHIITWNPVTHTYEATNTHQCASCHNLNPPEALRIVNGNVSSLADTAKTVYDMTAVLKDTDLIVGYKLVRPSTSTDSKAISVKLSKEADLLAQLYLRLYISDLACSDPEKTVCTPQTLRIYPYTANGVDIDSTTFVDYTTPTSPIDDIHNPMPTKGWHQIDVTPLLTRMKGLGWVKFRLTNTTANTTTDPAVAEATMVVRYKRHMDVYAASAMALTYNTPTGAGTLPNNQAPAWTETTTLLKDGNFTNGILVQKTAQASSAAVMKLGEEPGNLKNASIRLYISLPDGAAQNLVVYPYLADGKALNTSLAVTKTITATGWHEINVTPLLQSMQGFGWAKFRIVDNSTQALVTEGVFTLVRK